jgi:uncharacterized protein GlcG (DUF336 family)
LAKAVRSSDPAPITQEKEILMSSLIVTQGSVALAAADSIIDAALEHGQTLGLGPLTVAVLDSAGELVALKRQNNSSLMRPKIAQAKAAGALGMGMGSRGLAERAQAFPAFINAVTALAGGYLIPVPGGVLIHDGSGMVLGAVGISGALPDQDEACAVHGISSVGLVAVTGAVGH